MADSTEKRKYYRFPAFDDAEGVKLESNIKRQLFDNGEPVFLTKDSSTYTSDNQFGASKSVQQSPLTSENHQEEEPELTPTKAPNWEPKKNVKAEDVYKGLKINKVRKFDPENRFESDYTAPVMKRETKKKSWLPPEVEERIDKQTALEDKLANTRFAEPKNRFKPKNIPQQRYNGDSFHQQSIEKTELVQQLSDQKNDYLLFADESETNYPELTGYDEAQNEQTNLEKKTEVEAEQKEKRKIPTVTKRDFGSDVKAVSSRKKTALEEPAIKKKLRSKEEDNSSNHRSRLEKSLSGIMSEQPQLKQSIYFED